MPPKKAASKSPTKVEAPTRASRRGTPKKPEEEVDEAGDAPLEELAEEPEVIKTPARRGRPKKNVEQNEEPEIVTIISASELAAEGIDLDDMLSENTQTTGGKKRGKGAKQASAKKPKAEASPAKDAGAAGDGENLLQCPLCDAQVVQLVRHIRAQHADDENYDNRIKDARAQEARAQIASPRKPAGNLIEELNASVAKMDHFKVETRREQAGSSLVRPKNTQCPICDKVVRRYDLNKHIRNVHSGDKPNKCPYCDYASPWKGNLNTHIAGVHTKARLHDCIRCGLSFKTRSAMIGHVRKVHDKMYQPKERLFECVECNKKFYKKFHLQRHIRVHTGEKPFTCAFCEKPFASKTNMDSHIQSVHLKIKPFKCGYCEKGFARKKMMLVHIKKFHMNKNELDMDMDNDDDNLLQEGVMHELSMQVPLLDGHHNELLKPEEQKNHLLKFNDQKTEMPKLDDRKNDVIKFGKRAMHELDNPLLGEQNTESDNESIESGEMVDTGGSTQMVLMKLKGGDSANLADGGTKYVFVNADTLPSDGDTTLDTTADQSMLDKTTDPVVATSDGATAEDTESETAAKKATKSTGKKGTEGEAESAETSQAPVVIVDAAQMVEAVDTPAGIVLLAQTAEPIQSDAVTGKQPDLIQQAITAALPEVADGQIESPTKEAPIITEQAGQSLPANLLATEEPVNNTNGIVAADLDFLNNIDG